MASGQNRMAKQMSTAAGTVCCPRCNARTSPHLANCPSCRHDLGAPNVRACDTTTESNALGERWENAKEEACRQGLEREYMALGAFVRESGGVVVTMKAGFARAFLQDESSLYTNYESLVGAAARKPSAFDTQRTAVGGILFGSYAEKILYGVLSTDGSGPASYGEVHMRLREVSIGLRTSFLERNSFHFVDQRQLRPGMTIPPGHRAKWDNRDQLAAVKHLPDLTARDDTDQFSAYLIASDPDDRQSEEFIEAHIYDVFDRQAVESIRVATTTPSDRSTRTDLEVIRERCRSLGIKTM